MTAWTYLVVSSEKQADSLPAQSDWAKRVAKENGWTITRTFQSVSTGKAGARQLLEDLLSELRATRKGNRPERVLMIRLDRAGRGLAIEPLAALAEIYRLGVMVHTREDGDVTIERASDAIKPILRVLTGALEGEARRDKAKAKWRDWKARGRNGTLRPYGITVDADGRDIAQEPEADAIREAFRMRVKGAGQLQICMWLASNAPPRTRRDGTTRVFKWGRGHIQQVLCNAAYRGTVVDSEIWDAAQAVQNWEPPRRVRRFDWPLSGALRCYCGYLLTGTASGGSCPACARGKRQHNHARVRYYACWNPAKPHLEINPLRRSRGPKSKPGPKMRYLRADDLEAAFCALLRRLRASPELDAAYTARKRRASAEHQGLRRRIAELERQLTSFAGLREKAWSLHERGLVRDEDLQRRLDDLGREERAANATLLQTRVTIERQELAESNAKSASDLITRASAIFVATDVTNKRCLAQAVARALGGITVAKDGHLAWGNDPVHAPKRIARQKPECEQMREVNTLRDVQMAQRKADDSITKKFIESITE